MLSGGCGGGAGRGGADARLTSTGTLMAWAHPINAARTEYAAGVAYDDDADRDGPRVGTHVGVRGGKGLSLLRRIGWGMVAAVLALVCAAAVEAARLRAGDAPPP